MRQRDCYFDNAKFILIVLVVLGHGMELVGGRYISTLYRLVYLFHMPAFVLVTGYFAQKQAQPRVGGLLAQYLVFQTLYLLFDTYVLGGDTPFGFTTPYWILWFLVSVMLWKVITPLLARYPFAIVLAAGVVLAVLAGYDPTLSRFLSLSRTLVFFPFFWLGYHAKKEHFERLRRLPAWLPLLVFGASFAALHAMQRLPMLFLYGATPYAAAQMGGFGAGLSRLACLGWGFVLVCCFFALVPAGKTVFSALGQRTGQVFLLHGFVIRYLGKALPLPVLLDTTVERLLFMALLTAALLLLLHRYVAAACAPLLDPVRFFGRLRRARHP